MRRHLASGRARFRALPRWIRWPFVALLAFVVLSLAGFAFLWATVDLPDETPMPQSAVIVTEAGEELAVVAPEGLRFEVPLSEVAPIAVQSVLAAEDRNFYSHGGIDPRGIARALWQNVRDDTTQGGSTITQQLVKLVYTDGERSLTRKLREAILAMKLDRTADKDDILERYLNTVYFGRNAYGIEAAARAYFGISAAELTLPQSALLAGLIRSPETADPAEDPDEAARRRTTVLDALVETGDITEAERDEADASDLGAVAVEDRGTQATAAPHFVDRVREEAIDILGEEAVYGDGLRIVTTLDLRQQQAAELAIAEVLTEPGDPQAALIALDTDGAIRAYVGGRDYAALQLDLVRGAGGGGSGRQPGSTFKPFVLTAALQAGVTLGDRFPAPATIELDLGSETWEVDNYGGEGYGTLTVAQATADSVNTVYAQLADQVGPGAVADAAHQLGIQSELGTQPSVALGAEEVSPEELARAYLTLANDGNRIEPYAIVRIEDGEGNVVWEPDPPAMERAVDVDVARAVTYALRDVIESGTGTAADIDRPAAGKTGTTQDNVDAWFAGYVPGYASVVWMGYPEGSQPMDDVHGRSVTGGSFPAQIWARFMAAALDGREVVEFEEPPEDLLAESRDEPSVTAPTSTGGSDITTSSSTSTTAGGESTTSTTDGGDTTTTMPPTTAPPTTAAPTTTAPPDDGGGGGGGNGNGGGGGGGP